MNQFTIAKQSRLSTSPPTKRTDTNATPRRSPFSGRGRGGGGDYSSNFYQALQESEDDFDSQDKMAAIEVSQVPQSYDVTMIESPLEEQILNDEDSSVASIDTEMTSTEET
jgi:hypothetical protein